MRTDRACLLGPVRGVQGQSEQVSPGGLEPALYASRGPELWADYGGYRIGYSDAVALGSGAEGIVSRRYFEDDPAAFLSVRPFPATGR